MDYNSPILNNKKILDGDFYDLKSTIWEKIDDAFLTISYNFHIVKRDEEMRMDLISIRLYGDAKWTHLLCKFNDLKNPFDVRKDDKIKFTATTDELENFCFHIFELNTDNKELLNLYLDPTKKRKIDVNRENYLKEIDTPVTVNINNEPSIIYNNGILYVTPLQSASSLVPNTTTIEEIKDKINSPTKNSKKIQFAEYSKDNIGDADDFFSEKEIITFTENKNINKYFDENYLK